MQFGQQQRQQQQKQRKEEKKKLCKLFDIACRYNESSAIVGRLSDGLIVKDAVVEIVALILCGLLLNGDSKRSGGTVQVSNLFCSGLLPVV